jgi:hypothetical protein
MVAVPALAIADSIQTLLVLSHVVCMGTESERLIAAHDSDNNDNISHILSYFG